MPGTDTATCADCIGTVPNLATDDLLGVVMLSIFGYKHTSSKLFPPRSVSQTPHETDSVNVQADIVNIRAPKRALKFVNVNTRAPERALSPLT